MSYEKTALMTAVNPTQSPDTSKLPKTTQPVCLGPSQLDEDIKDLNVASSNSFKNDLRLTSKNVFI